MEFNLQVVFIMTLNLPKSSSLNQIQMCLYPSSQPRTTMPKISHLPPVNSKFTLSIKTKSPSETQLKKIQWTYVTTQPWLNTLNQYHQLVQKTQIKIDVFLKRKHARRKSIKLSVHVLYGQIKRIQGVLLRLDVRHQSLTQMNKKRISLLHARLIILKLNVLIYVQKIWRMVVVIDQSIAKFIHAQKM